ncbi:fibronectin type III domain-containing protein [Blastococcus sp. SYSU D00820]
MTTRTHGGGRATRWASAALGLAVTLGVTGLTVLGGATAASAGNDQHGQPEVVLNPGGGQDAGGADGLRIVLNRGDSSARGGDQLHFAGTYQYCCTAVAPMLSIGGDLYGEAGPAYDDGDGTAASFTGLSVVSTSGAASTTGGTATGDASATLRYTVERGGLTYTMDRTVSYTYPNDYFTDRYTFTIPAGNSEVVRFYKGGDTAPGSSDEGYGIQLTSPVRSVISLNPSSHIQVGEREIPGEKPFDGARAADYWDPYEVVAAGQDIGFVTETESHDAGLMVQWDLGTTAGTQTHAMETFVNFQGASLTAAFRASTAAPGAPVLLDLNVVNTALEPTSPIGYTFALPAGLTVAAGAPVNGCGGTLTASAGAGSITLAGGSVGATTNCVTSVPVTASSDGSYAIARGSASALTGLSNGVGSSTLTVSTPSTPVTPPVVTTPPSPTAPGAPGTLTAAAERSSIRVSWTPPSSGTAAARYRVTATPGQATCTTTGTSCVLGGEADTAYTISVVAVSAEGLSGPAATVVTTAVAEPEVPSSPPDPATTTDLTTDKGDLTTAEPGQEITLIGHGFLPYSTVTLVVYSTPQTLGYATTDANGNFVKTIRVPTTLAAGQHTLVAYGVDPDGDPHSMAMAITVGEPGATPVASSTVTGGLAYTGTPFEAVPVAVAGGLLLVAGAALVVTGRRRRAVGTAVEPRPAD